MIFVVARRNLTKALEILRGAGETPFEIGAVVKARGSRVVYAGGEE